MPTLRRLLSLLAVPFVWAAGEVWEKVNLPAVWREIKELAAKYGWRFGILALAWEIIEDVVLPYFAVTVLESWALAGFFWVFHFEPVVYPIFFWAFRQWDRRKGLIPEHPDRSAHSTSWRSWSKAWHYCLLTVVGLGYSAVLALGYTSNGMAVSYGLFMLGFFYIHERIWHDSNYGIRPDDTVESKRNIAKTVTYNVVAATVLWPFMHAFMGSVHVTFFLVWSLVAMALYLGQETVWSSSRLGIRRTVEFNRCNRTS